MNGQERKVKAMDKSFESVYTEYYTPVYRYILSMCRDSYTAEEIAQETFFKALKNIEKYNPEQKMLTWLCAIGKNTYFTLCRKQKRSHDLVESFTDSEDDIIDRIIGSEESMIILKHLHNLSEPYKEVFTLRVLGSLTFSKIATVFGKTESWARVTFFRAKIMIKESIENE